MLRKWVVITCLMGALALGQERADRGSLPPEARTLLNRLPGKTLSLDLIVAQAITSTDSFRALEAEKFRIPVAQLQAEAALDTQLTLQGNYLDNQNEVANNFQPNRTLNLGVSVELAKQFATGTQLAARVAHGHTELGFPIIPGLGDLSTEYFDSIARLSLTQNLWRDAFGSATRKQLEAGELQSESARFAYEESLEQWLIQLIEQYYQAWYAKARARAAEDGVERQRTLVRITQLKNRRGTAEKPDVIQVESNFAQTRLEADQSIEALRAIWRDLVLSLKLPEAWIAIDPMLIPISLPNPVEEARGLCGPAGKPKSPPQDNAELLRAQKQAEAARLAEQGAASLAAPDLKLAVGLEANGIDLTSGGNSFSETLRAEHPRWSATMTLRFPIGFSAEKARYLSARADALRADALASNTASRIQVNWHNQCADLHRLTGEVETLERTYRDQVERVRLEERRFEVGRSSVLQFIQSDADARATELRLRTAQRDLHLASWRVRRLARELKTYVENLLKNPPELSVFQQAPRWVRGRNDKESS